MRERACSDLECADVGGWRIWLKMGIEVDREGGRDDNDRRDMKKEGDGIGVIMVG
jgi:hypothetical protein